MIFLGEPNLTVRIIKARRQEPKVFKFDNEGKFETENPLLINRLKLTFKFEEIKRIHCKKCDFECNTKGELTAHCQTEHPKGVK